MTSDAMNRLEQLPGFKSAGEQKWIARCPGHEDKVASLSIGVGDDGKILLHCHAGCDLERILEASGLRMTDLFDGNGRGPQASEPRITATYDYQTADGKLSYQVVRFEPKDFRARRPDGNGGWTWDVKGLKRLPYHLPELVKAEYIFIAEGEKDVDNLRKIGLTATCNPFGACKWTAELSQYFTNRQRIAVLRDNDETGRKHQWQVAGALYGTVASLKTLEIAGIPDKGDVSDWLKERDPEAAAEELSKLAEAAPEWSPEEPQERPATAGWKLYDAGSVHEWPQDPLKWLTEPLIPKGGIGFMSAPPKDRKSLLTLDLSLHLAQKEPRLWLGKFKVMPTKVLYIAREDPLRRIKERTIEICNSYGMPLPEPGRLHFLVRERIHLTEPEHLAWLKTTIRESGFELLILDVINRMHPDLDEISAKDMGCLVGILEELNRDLGITILADDHTRKPQGKKTGRDDQEPNPFDLKGSMAKYGCADFMICLSRTRQANRMQVYCENKDTDERPHFFLDVSPKGSPEPKFTYAGSIERAAADMKQKGEENRAKVLEGYDAHEWRSRKDVAKRIGLGISATGKHTADLLDAEKLEQRGSGRSRQYRQSTEQGENIPRSNSDKGLFGND